MRRILIGGLVTIIFVAFVSLSLFGGGGGTQEVTVLGDRAGSVVVTGTGRMVEEVQDANVAVQSLLPSPVQAAGAAVITSSSVNFGPAPQLENGGAPNAAAVAMRSALSSPAHDLVAEISPRWARAAQVSATSGDRAAEEFAVGMLNRLSEMSMQLELSVDEVDQLHTSSSIHFESVLQGDGLILSPPNVED
jgi:hypothetical protein